MLRVSSFIRSGRSYHPAFLRVSGAPFGYHCAGPIGSICASRGPSNPAQVCPQRWDSSGGAQDGDSPASTSRTISSQASLRLPQLNSAGGVKQSSEPGTRSK